MPSTRHLLALAAATVALSACGGDDEPAVPTPAPRPTLPPTATPSEDQLRLDQARQRRVTAVINGVGVREVTAVRVFGSRIVVETTLAPSRRNRSAYLRLCRSLEGRYDWMRTAFVADPRDGAHAFIPDGSDECRTAGLD